MPILDLIIDNATAFIVLAIFSVVGFGIFYSTNTTGWSTSVIQMWGYIPIIFIVVGIIGMITMIKYHA
jgi:Na+/serine symporter